MKVCSGPWLMWECSPEGAGSPAINWGETGDVGAVHPSPPCRLCPAEVSAPRGDKLGHVPSLIGDEINPVSSDSGGSALTSLRRY